MRTALGLLFGVSFGLGFLGCSSDESPSGSPPGAGTGGGVSSTGGRASGGATGGSAGASTGGRAGASGAGGAAGGGGSSGTGGSAGADAGVDGAPGDAGTDGEGGANQTLTWDFTSSADGWTGGFSDYPSSEETFYELAFAQSAMPAEVGPGGGLKIAGNNHSDDLFMFVAKEITGLTANTSYVLDIQARIATNAPSDCAGIGGAPGTSVFFKMGVVSTAPASAASSPDGSLVMQMNLDKGNQGTGGADMQLTGDIANTKLCPDETYQLKTLTLTGFSVTSSANGRLWIVLGTDSGFEGITTLYYDRVTVSLHPA